MMSFVFNLNSEEDLLWEKEKADSWEDATLSKSLFVYLFSFKSISCIKEVTNKSLQ